MDDALPVPMRHPILKVLGLLVAAAIGSAVLGFLLGLGRPRRRPVRTGG